MLHPGLGMKIATYTSQRLEKRCGRTVTSRPLEMEMDNPEIRNILIAEDDPDDRIFITEALKPIPNLRLHFVENGNELLDYLHNAQETPHLVLLDIEMPLMNGREVLQRFRSNGYKTIPVICLTSFTNEKDRVFCMENGARGYVNKPSSFKEFSRELKAIVARWAR
jgi:DNA-binding response OmpR family regulator